MTLSSPGTLGIDFGTSNSAMAWAPPGGLAQPIALEGDAVSMPTAVFYNAEDHLTHFGRDAVSQYLASTEGRLMRSLKSLLGSSLLQEKTEINHQTISFQDIIATFLAELRQRAAQKLGHLPTEVVLGRPVHFVDDDLERDAQAEQSLREAAQSVGFSRVRFQLEPIAAALDYERRLTSEARVLVADIGGGTSDFTVVRLGPDRTGKPDRSEDVLATTGVHIGGTDFDQKLSLERVMPLLGHRHIGPQGREVPSRVFFDLSTWHLIQWLYLPRALAQTQALRVNYSDTRLHERLMRVLDQRDGHRVAHEVELAKIRCSENEAHTMVDLEAVETDLMTELSIADMRQHLDALLQRTVVCGLECVLRANLRCEGALDAIYLTGGSSALKPFQQSLQSAFPGVPLVQGDLFGGVASGLAYSGR
jgi:hypothetical chaperone protein